MAEQGETYAKFIEGELKFEYERRTAVESRALAVATSSSAFLALVFALSALVLGKEHKFSAKGAVAVIAALILFAIAAVIGLVANASRVYEVPSVPTLSAMTKAHWKDSEIAARNVSAVLNVKTIASLRNGNNDKAELVRIAFVVQLLAIAVLLVALSIELSGSLD